MALVGLGFRKAKTSLAWTYLVRVTDATSDAFRHAAGDMQPAASVQPAPIIGVGQHICRAGSMLSEIAGPAGRDCRQRRQMGMASRPLRGSGPVECWHRPFSKRRSARTQDSAHRTDGLYSGVCTETCTQRSCCQRAVAGRSLRRTGTCRPRSNRRPSGIGRGSDPTRRRGSCPCSGPTGRSRSVQCLRGSPRGLHRESR